MGTETVKNRCVIIGSAPVDELNLEFIREQVTKDDFLVCADGGYQAAKSVGLSPGLLIGDLDSCKEPLPQEIDAIHLPVRKDDTDMMFSVKECLKRGFSRFLILGGIGGRLDHTVANLSALHFLATRGAQGILADWQNEAVLLLDGKVGIQGQKGSLVSVFPYGAPYCVVSYEGLEYPLAGARLYSYDPMGVSNRVVEESAKITVHEGPALIIMAKEN